MSDVDPRLVAAMREQLARRPAGGTHTGGGDDLHADVELAVELAPDFETARYGVALEICDLAGELSVEELAAADDYHRAVAFGSFAEALPPGLEGRLVVNGDGCAAGHFPDNVADRGAAIGRVLDAVGERLQPGDRIITGLIVNTPVRSGDEVVAEIDELGRAGLGIA